LVAEIAAARGSPISPPTDQPPERRQDPLGTGRRLLREPTLHFLALGAVLFALHPLLTPTAPDATPATAPAPTPEVVVGAAKVQGLIEGWQQAWQRAPTREELDQLVEEEVRAEILAREAVALGLDRDDEVIRGILRDKMEFLAENSASIGEPADADLRAVYAANPARFGGRLVLSFSQIPVRPESGDGDAGSEARELLTRLRAGAAEPPELPPEGDGSGLPRDLGGMPEADVASMFGRDFTQALLDLPLGRWAGPISSAYGTHLVRVGERAQQEPVPFEEVRDSLREEWHAARAQELRDRAYRAIRERYRIVIESPPPVATAAARPAVPSP